MDPLQLSPLAKLARAFVMFCLILRVNGGALDSWTWRNPLPSAHPIFDVTFGSGKFVAVGESGTVMTSTDAKSWTFQDSGKGPFPLLLGRVTLERIVYLNNRFIALSGSSFGGQLLSSADGTNWITSSLGLAGIVEVAYGNGVFVVVGNEDSWMQEGPGQVWTSTDAIHWVNPLNLDSLSLFSGASGLVFAGGRFVIRPYSRTLGVEAQAFTSTDGEVWTPISVPESMPRFWGVRNFRKAAFAATGTNIWVSNDAIAWIAQNSGITSELYGLSVSEDAIFALGPSTILRSTDGLTWTEQPPVPTDNFLISVAGGNGAMAAAPQKSIDSWDLTFFSFPDGGPWRDLKSGPSAFELFSLDANDGLLVAGGHTEARPSRDGLIIFSHAGAEWTEVYNEPLAWFVSITHGKGLFLAAGWSTAVDSNLGTTFVISSTDGRNWGNRVDVDYASFNGAAFGNDTFVIAGGLYFSEIASSRDAISWTTKGLDSNDDTITAVAFGNGIFVAVGYRAQGVFGYAKVWTSPDGVNWSDAEIAGVGGFNGILFAEGQFLATGSGGTIFTSIDGKQWSKKFENGDASFGRVAYGNGVYLALDNPNLPILAPDTVVVWSSTEGTDWQNHIVPGNISSVVFEGESFFTAGSSGTILQSDPILSARIITASPAAEGIALQIRGAPGQSVAVYRSPNLMEWNLVGTITLTSNAQTFLDTTSANSTLGFYKLGLPPKP